jgi:hypothetical protein
MFELELGLAFIPIYDKALHPGGGGLNRPSQTIAQAREYDLVAPKKILILKG